MTKKDYIKFAELLAHAKAYSWSAERITVEVSRIFASDNDRFDAVKFMRAIDSDVSVIRIGSGVATR